MKVEYSVSTTDLPSQLNYEGAAAAGSIKLAVAVFDVRHFISDVEFFVIIFKASRRH